MRILFIGTGEIGAPSLRWLLEQSDHRIVGVVCQPDKPAGRHQVLTVPATKALAMAAGVPVFQPEKIGDACAELAALQPDVTVVMAYGQFLPRAVREAPRLACINLHASLLPRWRGASPIQSAIAAGDAETGVTVMHVAREMDAGDLILAVPTPIRADDTGRSLHDRLAEIAPTALRQALPLIEAGAAPRTPQTPAGVTHCAKLSRGLGRLDWSRPAVEIERQIRAYDPWPGTHTTLPDGRTLKVFPPVSVVPSVPMAVAGTIVAAQGDELAVAAGDAALALSELQRDGQRRMTVRDFLAGQRFGPGARLGDPGANAAGPPDS